MRRECFDEQTKSITILATTAMRKNAVRSSCLPRTLASHSANARDNTAIGTAQAIIRCFETGRAQSCSSDCLSTLSHSQPKVKAIVDSTARAIAPAIPCQANDLVSLADMPCVLNSLAISLGPCLAPASTTSIFVPVALSVSQNNIGQNLYRKNLKVAHCSL